MNSFLRRSLSLGLATALSACATSSAPDWQIAAHSAMERFESAYLTGNTAIETVEFQRARKQLASSGQVERVIDAELLRCALQVASLVMETCSGFTLLSADATAPQRAYAHYLSAQAQVTALALLPPAQRAVASASSDDAAAAAMQDTADPLSRLVAAAILLRSGRATPALLSQAVDTASQQGWRRPLLAWLGVQLLRAKQAGAQEQTQRIQRRINLVLDEAKHSP